MTAIDRLVNVSVNIASDDTSTSGNTDAKDGGLAYLRATAAVEGWGGSCCSVAFASLQSRSQPSCAQRTKL
jgi:hypothetical protein